MKIAIIGPSKKYLSGVSYYTIRLSNALSNYTDVKTILFRNMLPKRLFPGWKRVGKDLTKLEFNKRVEVHEILDWNNPISWIKAFKIAKDCDAIILQWWTSSVAHMHFALEFMNRLSEKIPTIIEFHEVVDPLESSIMPIRIYSRVMGRLVRMFADCYVVHSNADKDLISKVYGIPKSRIYVIPHGIYDHYVKIDKNLAKEKLGIDEDFVILFFGLLRPYKGVKYLIKAFENLPENIIKNSRLLIVGETWEDEESVELARRSRYSEMITLINRYVPDSEVSLYFSSADVVALPYLRASQSGVAHIAMAFGLPIIATPVGGLKESLANYNGTIFINPKDIEALSKAILKVYECRKTYRPPENLRWTNIAKKWVEIMSKIYLY